MKTLIITGGSVDIDFLRKYISQNTFDFIISVDKGTEYTDKLGLIPDLVIGDFDSAKPKYIDKYSKMQINIKQFSSDKGKTDTHLAIEEAINNNSKEIVIVGGIGTRLDHTISNIHILMMPLSKKIKCSIVNKNNIINLANHNIKLCRNEYKYISLIPLTNEVRGITTNGLKYELVDYTLKQGISIGISNEFEQEKASISINEGILIIIRSRD